MTDKQLAVLIREYIGRVRREINDALELLPDEAKQVRKFALTDHEYITAPALSGFEDFAQELATTAEVLERDSNHQ